MKQYLHFVKRDERGVTMIEFALIAPLLLLLIMGVIEFALMMYVSSALENGARFGARFGITGDKFEMASRQEKIISEIVNSSYGMLDPSDVTIDVKVFKSFSELDTTTATGGTVDKNDLSVDAFGKACDPVLYTISYDWALVTPLALISNYLVKGSVGSTPDNVLLQASTLAKNEQYQGRCAAVQ